MVNMRRREFITLLGGATATWPLAARAQQRERMRRVGVLMAIAADDPQAHRRMTAFVQGLQELGWADGRNIPSTPVGPQATPTACVDRRRNWSRWHRTSFWPLAAPSLGR